PGPAYELGSQPCPSGGPCPNQILIGTLGTQRDTYIQGIWGSTVPAPSTVVCVDRNGKLGSIHPGCSLSLQGQIKTELDQVIAQQQQQIESLQKQNAEFQQRLSRLESLIAQK